MKRTILPAGAATLAILVIGGPAHAARVSIRDFPSPQTCPVHRGWFTDADTGAGIAGATRIQSELTFFAGSPQAALTFST
ncbi:MAG: hypothetical protein ACREBE_25185, partial [bacterium]